MKFAKRKSVLISFAILISMISVASASPNPFSRALNQTVSRLTQAFSSRIDAFTNVTISKTLGALGIPDPQSVEQQIKDLQTAKGGNITTTIEVLEKELGTDLSKAAADSILGKKGQEAQLEVSKRANTAVQGITNAQQQARNIPVTQRKLDKLLEQNRLNAEISQSILSAIQESNRQEATANRNLGDINDTLTSQERSRQAELDAEAESAAATGAFHQSLWQQDLF